MRKEIRPIAAVARLHELLPLIRSRYGVEELFLFGSYARQEQDSNSDLDILITFSADPPDLLKFIELENILSDAPGIKVDLLMKDALKPAIGERIMGEAIPV